MPQPRKDQSWGARGARMWDYLLNDSDISKGVRQVASAPERMFTSPTISRLDIAPQESDVGAAWDATGWSMGGGLAAGAPAGSAAMGALRRQRPDTRAPQGVTPPPAAPAGIGHNRPPLSYNEPAGSDPRYLGAAPDRSSMTFLRYKPGKVPERMQRAEQAMLDENNPIRQQMLKDIEVGRNFKGADWYNTEELRDWFVGELGEEAGNKEWDDFLRLMGSSSAGSNVLTNIKNASAVRRLQALNPEVPGTGMTYNDFVKSREEIGDFGAVANAREQLLSGEKGYGHRYNKLHEMTSARQQRGEWEGNPEPGMPAASGSWVDNPKPKGFYNSFTGNPNNIAADLHFTRYMGMASDHPDWLVNGAEVSNTFQNAMLEKNPNLAPYFRSKDVKGKILPVFDAQQAAKDGVFSMSDAATEPSVWTPMPKKTEYGVMERLMSDIGKQVGLTAPQVQAALWMGAAKRTRVHEDSLGTFMELIRNRADIRAKETGSTREDVLRNFIKNKGLLANPAEAGAAVTATTGATPRKPTEKKRKPTIEDLVRIAGDRS